MPTLAELMHDGSNINISIRAKDDEELMKGFGRMMKKLAHPTKADMIKRSVTASMSRVSDTLRGLPHEERAAKLFEARRGLMITAAAEHGVNLVIN